MLALALLPVVFLPAVFLAFRVAAGPVLVQDSFISLPISRRFNFTGSATIVQADLARVHTIKSRKSAKISAQARAVVSEPVSNQVVSYIVKFSSYSTCPLTNPWEASVGVGSPITTYDLIVDTGSSNTWVGAKQAYVRTSTSTQTSNIIFVNYGNNVFMGTEFTDQVTLASGLVIAKQSIGVASHPANFGGVDGFLGMGPVNLTIGTLTNARTTSIPTVTDNLFSQGTITSHLIGISFAPTTVLAVTNGEINFGGIDSSRFTGAVTFTSITSTSPATDYWGINQSISYGGRTILASTAGIVDTGMTVIYIADDAFNLYQRSTGAVLDANTGLLRVTSAQFAALQNLNFVIGGTTFALTPNAQIWPRALNTAIGGSASSIYLVVANLGTPSGVGLDFINGCAFLERFYVVFDSGNRRIGFATTPSTTATSN